MGPPKALHKVEEALSHVACVRREVDKEGSAVSLPTRIGLKERGQVVLSPFGALLGSPEVAVATLLVCPEGVVGA